MSIIKIIPKLMLLSAVLFLLFLPSTFSAQALSAQNVLKEGNWDKIMYSVKGSWQIVQKDSKLQIVLGEDFSTTNAPDLNLVLSPLEASQINSSNAMNNAKEIGFLKGKTSWGKLKGPIILDLPEGTDLSKYKSIVIHCVEYSKTWAAGKL